MYTKKSSNLNDSTLFVSTLLYNPVFVERAPPQQQAYIKTAPLWLQALNSLNAGLQLCKRSTVVDFRHKMVMFSKNVVVWLKITASLL